MSRPPRPPPPPPDPAPASLDGARKAPLPRFVEPQLAAPQPQPPDGPGWLHEIKHDGYRALVRIDQGEARLLTRGGHDWTERYGSLAAAFAPIAARPALLDGEIVVQDDRGVSSFAALQDALSRRHGERLLFYAFDLLHLDGWDLTPAPLLQRKRLLQALLQPHVGATSALQWSDHLDGDGTRVLREVCNIGLEGIVSKRACAPYRSGRSPLWIKCRCVTADRFAIVGFTRTAATGGLAALHLGERTAAGLVYVGKVGSGFGRAEAARLERLLAPLARATPPLPLPAGSDPAAGIWVEPRILADVGYATRTGDGRLRHAVFRGIAGDAGRAAAADGLLPASAADDGWAAAPAPPPPPSPVGDGDDDRFRVSDDDLRAIWITNPGRRMFAAGADAPTKLDILRHYARVAPMMLPELVGRPLSLLRCPTGRADDCFFQRHAAAGMPAAIARVPLPVSAGGGLTAPHPVVEDVRGLLALAQFGVVEFHPWGCRAERPEDPDRLILDLDPDAGLAWQAVAEAAFMVRAALAELGLAAFVNSSGGKGLHVHTPLRPGHSWSAHGRFALALAQTLCRRQPLLFTLSAGRRHRRDRIYLDHLRNRRGATAVAGWSLRARPGLPVAVPLAWSEIRQLEDPLSVNISTWQRELPAAGVDPWRGMQDAAVALTNEMAKAIGLADLT